MLQLTSAGKNGGRIFTLSGGDEPFITNDLGEVAQQIVSEWPEIAETIIHDYQANKDLRELVCDLGPVDRKDFLGNLVECFCSEHRDFSLAETGDD